MGASSSREALRIGVRLEILTFAEGCSRADIRGVDWSGAVRVCSYPAFASGYCLKCKCQYFKPAPQRLISNYHPLWVFVSNTELPHYSSSETIEAQLCSC